jgi:hypothetical protein
MTNQKPASVLVMIFSISLTACVGGGGGGGGGGASATLAPFVRNSVPYHAPIAGGNFQPLVGAGTKSVIQDIYTRDLNQDQIDEVVVGGRTSQPVTQAEWRDYNLQIYGWNTGAFKRETSTWFSGSDNRILGTEPSIRFGDFNGDGNVDMFVAPSTDMPYYGNGIVYFNSGVSSFSRSEITMTDVWAHDSTVADFNGDGFSDILTLDYNGRPVMSFGSASGTFSNYRGAIGTSSGSGVSAADYLGDGSKTFVVTDAAQTGNQDTKLYSWDVTTGELRLTEIAALPASRFYLPKWDAARTAAGWAPHEIRNIAMDFDRDGRMDVVVVSTLPNIAKGDTIHGYSEVQFLKNQGGGVFVDVTDTVLVGYNNETKASYNPVILDVNQDGLPDILLSVGGQITDADSSRVLLATSDGFYKESYVSVFQDFLSQIRSSTANAFQEIQPLNIAKGPGNNLYLIGMVNFDDGGTMKTQVYAAKIDSNGTLSVQATLDAVNSTWPYLSGAGANTVLARSSPFALDGVPVVDWYLAMTPIDGLGISLDGRLGTRRPITGGISVPGLDRSMLGNLSAVDGVGRHFQVNMSSMSAEPMPMSIQHSMIEQDVTQNWASRLVDGMAYSSNNLDVRGGSDRFSFSASDQHFGSSSWVNRVGVARMPGSPWLAFSGIFGQVNSSTILDFSTTKLMASGYFAQAGIMQTVTEFSPGLVTDISDIWAGYMVFGQNQESWSLYGGMQPTIFSGSIKLKLPTSVDQQGTMYYTEKNVSIRNQPVAFAGAEYRFKISRQQNMKMTGVANNIGNYQLQLIYSLGF